MNNKMEKKSGVKWSLLLVLVCIDQSLQQPCQEQKNSGCTFSENNADECEFHCPSYFVDSRFDIKIWSGDDVRITCNLDPPWSDFKLNYSSGAVEDVDQVIFTSCSLPQVSLHEITERIGVQPTEKLKFESFKDLSSSLERRHLSGFPRVKHLSLNSNNLRQVPEDLLNDFPELTVLVLRQNKLELPENFFSNIPMLQFLELGDNDIKYLNPLLFSGLERLELLNLWSNELTDIEPRTFVDLTALKSLDLQNNKMTTLRPEVFKPLKNLTVLSIAGNYFTSLPEDLLSENQKLTALNLKYNRVALTTLPNRFLSNLPQLKNVHLNYNKLRYLPEDLLANSSSIKVLNLNHNSLSTLPQSIFKDSINLKSLDLSWNKITSLPDRIFKSMRKLETLELQNNHIFEISQALFSGLRGLENLNLESNEIRNIHRDSFGPLRSLKFAHLSDNQITLDDDVFPGIASPFRDCQNLVELHLANNSITQIFQDWMYSLEKIKKIDLKYNLISEVNENDFNFVWNQFTLDIRHNNIKTIDLSNAPLLVGYSDMGPIGDRDVAVLVDDNPIVCDCRLNSFLKYLNGHMHPDVKKLFQIKSDQLKCSGPESMAGIRVSDLKYESFVCHMRSECGERCDCLWREYDNTIIADCSNRNLREIPKSMNFTVGRNVELDLSGNLFTEVPSINDLKYGNITALLLSHNKISSFSANAVMPPSLKVLELHGNDMKRIDTTTLESVVSTTSLKRLTLHKNPWICDCEANSFRKFIRNNERRLPEIWNTSCGDGTHDEMKFSTMANDDLCPCQPCRL